MMSRISKHCAEAAIARKELDLVNKEYNFTSINHDARKKLELSANEYIVAEMIYQLSGDSRHQGWCFASKSWMAEQLGLAKTNVVKLIGRLVAKGILIKDTDARLVKTSEIWFDTVIVKTIGDESSPVKEQSVTNHHLIGDESSPPSDNDITNKRNTNKESYQKYITQFNEKFSSQYRPTQKRWANYSARLASGYTSSDILRALDRMAKSPWHHGDNDRGWTAPPEFLIRNDEKLDEWLNKKLKVKDEFGRIVEI